MRRPYPTYVRASDFIAVTLDVGGLFSSPETPIISGWFGGFPVSDLGAALQRHSLFLNTIETSQWSSLAGGTLTVRVGPTVDFSQLSDVADAVAQAVQEVGFPTWYQVARFLSQVPDDVTQSETDPFSDRAGEIDWSQNRDSIIDRFRNAPQDLSKGVDDLVDDLTNPLNWKLSSQLIVLGGIGLVLMIALAGSKR